MSKVFINYRRADDQGIALLLCRELQKRHKHDVFIDVAEIIVGSEFPDKLRQELTESDLMIAVLGMRWLDLLKEKSKSVERDFVKVEIEITLSNKIPIIPPLTGAASMPKEHELPDSIKGLSNIHAISFRSDAVDHSINQLLNGIEDCIRRRNERREAEQVAAAKRESERLAFEIEHDRFRSRELKSLVATILRTQHQTVQEDVAFNKKQLDIVYSYNDFGRIRTIGLVCLPEETDITPNILKQRVVDQFSETVAQNRLSLLILVTKHPVSSSSSLYADTIPYLRIRTLEQLQDDALGLRSYVETLSLEFDSDRLNEYYIDVEFDGFEQPALATIEHWLRSDSPQLPIAILGGYGTGKTSFARRLASVQAKRYLADPTERIPILVLLGTTVHETQLEGIFGKQFTSRFATPNFHFRTLAQMNNAGRLLVIFDGFDEMKHGMSAADFRANFREINRLNEADSRVIILGRPNALPTDTRILVFKGERQFGKELVRDPSWGTWRELSLKAFDKPKALQFLVRYFQSGVSDFAEKTFDCTREPSKIVELVDPDLLSRPVQARMVADLALQKNIDLASLRRRDVYQYFIERSIERDTEKKSRSGINNASRLEFQRRLAWWSWTRDALAQSVFLRDEIPFELLDGLDIGEVTSKEALLNEYIVSTLTEEKEAGVLRFAHRSFQEHLVAEYVAIDSPSARDHYERAKWITPDVASFIGEIPDRSFLKKWHNTLAECSTILPVDYLGLFNSDNDFLKFVCKHRYDTDRFMNSLIIVQMQRERAFSSSEIKEEAENLFASAIYKGSAEEATFSLYCALADGVHLLQVIRAMFMRLTSALPFGLKDKIIGVHRVREAPLEVMERFLEFSVPHDGEARVRFQVRDALDFLTKTPIIKKIEGEPLMLPTFASSYEEFGEDEIIGDNRAAREFGDNVRTIIRVSRKGIKIVYKDKSSSGVE